MPSMVTSKDKVDSVVHMVVTNSHMTEPETMFQWTARWTFSLKHSTLETTKPSLDSMLINLSLVVDSLSNGTQEECTNTTSLMFSKLINSSLKKPPTSSQKSNSTLKEVRFSHQKYFGIKTSESYAKIDRFEFHQFFGIWMAKFYAKTLISNGSF